MLTNVNANNVHLKTSMARTPLRRVGRAHAIADVVTFLCSSKFSFITGETIFADGVRLALYILDKILFLLKIFLSYLLQQIVIRAIKHTFIAGL